MNKKKLMLGLILVLFVFGLAACKKRTNDDNPGTGNNGGDKAGNVIKMSSETKTLEIFNDMINNIEFTSDIAGTTSNSLTATIMGDGVINATFNDLGITKEVKINAVLKGLGVVNNNGDDGYIHVLTEDGHMYYVKVTKTSEPVVYKYDIENVESFASLDTDLEGKGESQAAVIIKSKNGEYYTDYKFTGDSNLVLRKIN